MKIQNEWSSFRLTLLLYSIIFIIPLTFYFVYTSFNDMEDDTKVVYQIGWINGLSKSLTVVPSYQFDQQVTKDIDDKLQNISIWVTKNRNSEFYLGGQTLSKDYSDVTACWTEYKQNLSQSNTPTINTRCSDLIRNLTVIIENMVNLKQNKLINMFYWNLAIAMLLSLLLIYMVRTYIHIQMKKHAIYDLETKLFNKKFLLSELRGICPRSVRHKFPLSVLSFSIINFDEMDSGYNKKTRQRVFNIFGEIILSVTRVSDIACRYDESHFYIILPFTEEKNALILEGRVREILETHDFETIPEPKFKFATLQFNGVETTEAFITRIEDQLK